MVLSWRSALSSTNSGGAPFQVPHSPHSWRQNSLSAILARTTPNVAKRAPWLNDRVPDVWFTQSALRFRRNQLEQFQLYWSAEPPNGTESCDCIRLTKSILCWYVPRRMPLDHPPSALLKPNLFATDTMCIECCRIGPGKLRYFVRRIL